MNRAADPSDFDALIDAYLEGDATHAAVAALDHWLDADAANPARFTARAELHARLAAVCRPPERIVSGDSAGRTDPAVHPPHTPTLRPPKRLVYPLAAALLLAAAAVAIYLFAFNSLPKAGDAQPETRNPKPAATPIATILDTAPGSTLVVDDTIVSSGDDIRSGDFFLDTGSAEFRLSSGVTVWLRGHSRLTVHDAMHATLDRGMASFDCPHHAAGYAVALPGGAKIVDIGTRFVVHQPERGPATVRVLQGLVRIDAADHSEPIDTSVVLTIDGGRVVASQSLDALRRRPLVNAALHRPAVQSTDHYPGAPGPTLFPAAHAVDGRPDTFTSTRGESRPAGVEPDLTPSWSVDLGEPRAIHRIVLHNRRNEAPWRLRDITVVVLDGDGVLFRSEPLNRHNKLNSPASLALDLIDAAGLPLRGTAVRIERRYDPDNRADAINESIDDLAVLSLGEVEVLAEETDESPAPSTGGVTPPDRADEETPTRRIRDVENP